MDGDASGRWEAKLLNWNCVAYKIPRNYIYPKEASYLPSGVIKMRKLHARDIDRNAACILGRNTNGRTAWVDKEGKTLKEIQEKKDN